MGEGGEDFLAGPCEAFLPPPFHLLVGHGGIGEGGGIEGALNPHSLPNASQTGHLSPACHKQNLGICNREGVESEGGREWKKERELEGFIVNF